MYSCTRERILAVERILNDRPQKASEIMDKLSKRYGIECDRKAIYQDIAVLTLYLPVCQSSKGYYVERGV